MKTMKRFLAAAMAVTSVMAIAPMSAFAENETGGSTNVTFDAPRNSPEFTITIPASVNLNAENPTATIEAEGVYLDTSKHKQINVTLDSAQYVNTGDSTFIAKTADGNSQVTYSIGKGEATTGVKVGDTVAEFTADGSQVLSFSAPTGATYAGTHTETLTFGISTASAVTILTSSHYTWLDGEYIAPENVTINREPTVAIDTILTIEDGVTVTTAGLVIRDGVTLTINGTGTIIVNGGISGSGKLIVNGVTVTATGSNGSSSSRTSGGNGISTALEVNSGSVTAIGGNGGNGSNSAMMGVDGTNGGNGISGALTITGGTVTASGGSGGAAGDATGQMGGRAGYAGSAGKGITGTLTCDGFSVQGSADNSTWTDASGNYNTYRYVKIGADS